MRYQDMYRQWLHDFAADTAMAAELSAIAGDEKEIEDRFYTGLSFGTGGHARRAWLRHQPHERVHRAPRHAGACRIS